MEDGSPKTQWFSQQTPAAFGTGIGFFGVKKSVWSGVKKFGLFERSEFSGF